MKQKSTVWKIQRKYRYQTEDKNQSKRTRETSSVNKSADVTEKILQRYTSTSSTATPSVLSVVQYWTKQQY